MSFDATDYQCWIPDLFAALWRELSPLTNSILTEPWHGAHAKEASAIHGVLCASEAGEVPPEVISYLQGDTPDTWPCECSGMERLLVVAQCIDQASEIIHPRSQASAWLWLAPDTRPTFDGWLLRVD